MHGEQRGVRMKKRSLIASGVYGIRLICVRWASQRGPRASALAVASPVATRTTQATIVSSASEASAARVRIYWTNSIGTTRGVVSKSDVRRSMAPASRGALSPYGGPSCLGESPPTVGISTGRRTPSELGEPASNGRGVNQRFCPRVRSGARLTGGGGSQSPVGTSTGQMPAALSAERTSTAATEPKFHRHVPRCEPSGDHGRWRIHLLGQRGR